MIQARNPLGCADPPHRAGPLAGLGVLVTRPARPAASFAQKIDALGGTPVIVPGIVILPPADIAPLERARDALPSYDAVIFVSANAVLYGLPDASVWPVDLVAFAPGPGTAEMLVALGIQQVRIPQMTYDSEGLLALSELSDVRGQRIAIFRGDGGREHLGDMLSSRGATVDYVTCYRRERPHALPGGMTGLREAFTEGRIGAITITSSEALDNLWSDADPILREAWAVRPTFVPHSRIALHARRLGLLVVETAGGDAGLIAGLLEWAAAQSFERK